MGLSILKVILFIPFSIGTNKMTVSRGAQRGLVQFTSMHIMEKREEVEGEIREVSQDWIVRFFWRRVSWVLAEKSMVEVRRTRRRGEAERVIKGAGVVGWQRRGLRWE